MKVARLFAYAALASLLACGDDSSAGDAATSADAARPDPAELACGEITEPGTPITAGGAADATAPLVEIGAEPYLVAVPPRGSGFVRVVTTSPETPAIAFFRATGVLTRVLGADGTTELPLASAGPDPFCDVDLPAHFDLDFETAGTYYLELTSASDAWFFLSSAEGHAH
jgi:hypothetical protein